MITVILAVLLVIVVLFILNEYYYRYVLYDTQEHHIMRGRRRKNLEWISFGSSYCRYGITTSEDEDGFNFGIAGQFFYYTDKMLREYASSCLRKNGKVYLIIADLVFAEVGRGWYGAQRYQEILTKESLGDEYSLMTKMKLRFPVISRPYKAKSVLRHFIKGNNKEFETLTVNPLSKEEVLKAAKQRCASWCSQFGLEDTFSTNISAILEKKFSQTRHILTGMIQFCLDNDFKPILVVTPVSKIMRSQLGEGFISKVLYDNIALANKQNVPFVDYLNDLDFDDSSLYAGNADFLNARGRKMFTEKLFYDTKDL